jgi:hypothetical protein
MPVPFLSTYFVRIVFITGKYVQVFHYLRSGWTPWCLKVLSVVPDVNDEEMAGRFLLVKSSDTKFYENPFGSYGVTACVQRGKRTYRWTANK